MKFVLMIQTSAGRFHVPVDDPLLQSADDAEVHVKQWSRSKDPWVAEDGDGVRRLVWPQDGMAVTIATEAQIKLQAQRAQAQAPQAVTQPILVPPNAMRKGRR